MTDTTTDPRGPATATGDKAPPRRVPLADLPWFGGELSPVAALLSGRKPGAPGAASAPAAPAATAPAATAPAATTATPVSSADDGPGARGQSPWMTPDLPADGQRSGSGAAFPVFPIVPPVPVGPPHSDGPAGPAAWGGHGQSGAPGWSSVPVQAGASGYSAAQSGVPAQSDVWVQPGAPAQSDMWVQPGAPAQSDMWVQPGEPVQPGAVGYSAASAQSDVWVQPGAPVQTGAPAYPGSPAQSDVWVHPGSPVQSGGSAQSDVWVHPGSPGQSAASAYPGSPVQPGAPDQSDAWVQPGASGYSGVSRYSEAPGHSGAPVQPGAPAEHAVPVLPAFPAWPAASASSAAPAVEVVAGAPPPPSGFDSDADLDSLFNLFSTPSEAGQPGEIDWAVVSELREEAAQRLSTWPGQQELTDAARRDVGRRIVEDLLGERAAEMLRAGGQAWDPETERAMAAAVVDMLFGLGRIQPLVDDPTIEDIYITGSDPTWLTHFGRPACAGPPVADTDQELVDFLAFIASRADPPRAFSPSQPNLDLNLGGGVARLSAQAWVTARPYATIRLHRHRQVTLDDLVALGTITPVLATFLSASVRAKLSLVVAGAMGAGKTTLLRALCAELDPDEPIGTFETDYELLLHDLPEQHRLVRAWEERQGQGDINQAGGRAGTFGLDQALFASFRQSLSRQIVGEVRGREIIPMIKAMQSGTGSLSTTHSQSARGAIDKLVTCAMETGVTEDYALRALGTSVQIVVYVAAEEVSGRRQRVVTEVVAVGFTAEGIQYTDVFTRASGLTGPARAAYLPDHLRLLTRHGFDLPAFNMDSAQYRMEVGG